jgi:hypothetical protein
MRLKVEMGANEPNQQKLTTETGELIEGVKSIAWGARAQDRPIVTVEFFAERMDFNLDKQEEPDVED